MEKLIGIERVNVVVNGFGFSSLIVHLILFFLGIGFSFVSLLVLSLQLFRDYFGAIYPPFLAIAFYTFPCSSTDFTFVFTF